MIPRRAAWFLLPNAPPTRVGSVRDLPHVIDDIARPLIVKIFWIWDQLGGRVVDTRKRVDSQWSCDREAS